MRKLILLLSLGISTYTCAQNYPALETVLSKELSETSRADGRWVFYADKANIKKLDKPEVKESFPGYELFQLTLTNYLGYHVNPATCAVLFDSLQSKIVLVEPLWYGDISEPLVRMVVGRRFQSKDDLLGCLNAMNEIMQIGSGYRFLNTGYTDSLITFDLGYFKDDSYTTGGNGISSTVRYNEDGVWRKIRIDVKSLAITRYTSINPKTKDQQTVEKN